MNRNPFSLQNEWVVHWRRLPSNISERPILGEIAKNEEQALRAIATVGLITSSQLLNLYQLGKNKLNRMIRRQRVVRHQLTLNNKYNISIYTLGINGAKIAEVSDYYEVNYWVRYRIEDVLKRIVFFGLYERFDGVELLPAVEPFIATLMINGKPMYVYVVRGDTNDLLMYLKWNKFNERMIIVTESLSHLEMLKPFLHDIKLRVILDEDILNPNINIGDAFYLFKDNEFIKEKEA